MKCPKCAGTLGPLMTAEGVELDFCDTCHGILFDRGEVAEYFELGTDVPDLKVNVKKAKRTDHTCPKCGANWAEIPYETGNNLLIDICPQCGVIFLDEGEFVKLEAIAAKLDKPDTKFMRAVKVLKDRGYKPLGVKKA